MSDSLDQVIEKIGEQYEVPASLIRKMIEMEQEVLHLKPLQRRLVPRLQEVIQKEIGGDET